MPASAMTVRTITAIPAAPSVSRPIGSASFVRPPSLTVYSHRFPPLQRFSMAALAGPERVRAPAEGACGPSDVRKRLSLPVRLINFWLGLLAVGETTATIRRELCRAAATRQPFRLAVSARISPMSAARRPLQPSRPIRSMKFGPDVQWSGGRSVAGGLQVTARRSTRTEVRFGPAAIPPRSPCRTFPCWLGFSSS